MSGWVAAAESSRSEIIIAVYERRARDQSRVSECRREKRSERIIANARGYGSAAESVQFQ
jgi:hypothetical protein